MDSRSGYTRAIDSLPGGGGGERFCLSKLSISNQRKPMSVATLLSDRQLLMTCQSSVCE